MSELYEIGLKVRRDVLGDQYVDNALRQADELTRDLQKMITEYCWGSSWARDGLQRSQRSLNILCILAALNRPAEFEVHFRAALRNGCTIEQLRETIIQIAVYAGVPAAVEASKIGQRVLREQGAVGG